MLEVWYVEIVVGLMVIGAWNPCQMTTWALVAAMALCLPAMIIWLPPFYAILGAGAWHLPGSGGGCGNGVLISSDGSAASTIEQLILVAAYALVIAMTAVTNVWLLRGVSRGRARRRRPSAELACGNDTRPPSESASMTRWNR